MKKEIMYDPSYGIYEVETFLLLHPVGMDMSDGATLEQVFHVTSWDKTTGVIETPTEIYYPKKETI